jgi:hypothetical protein
VKRIILIAALAACGHSSPTPAPGPSPTQDPLVAFETVRSVLQHPRCENCHPAGDVPLVGDDSRPHPQNVQRGADGHGRTGEECTTCHGLANPLDSYGAHMPPGIPTGWRMPRADQPLVFVGVSAHDLCERVKDPARNGGKDMNALRTHLDDPLVTWGWSPGFGRAPIPIPRDQFLAAWTTWANAGAPCPP